MSKDIDWYERRAAEERAEGREQNAIAYESIGKASSDQWRLNCQYLLDVLDQQGFSEADLSEEDENAIQGIRAALSRAEGRAARKDGA